MPRFAVLLRGVNVGKGNRLPMAGLRALLEGLGYMAVQTLLNSGNAVFASPGCSCGRHAANIAAAVEKQFGFRVLTIVKSADDLATIVKGNRIAPPEAEYSRFLVVFAPGKEGLQDLAKLQSETGQPY